MSGIAVFVPNEEMYVQAEAIIKEKDYHVKAIRLIQTEESVKEARSLICSEGINIIVARGEQLGELRRCTNVAVSEIQISAQEMGLLVHRAKAAVGKEIPVIAVFYWENTLCDTTYFDELYGVRLLRYQFHEKEDWRSVFARACENRPDMIIGSRSVRRAAEELQIPSMAFLSTGESLRTAVDNAESLYRMAEAEKRSHAQFTTVLDSTSNGIVKVSGNGAVLVINRVMESLTGIGQKRAVGMPVKKLLPELDEAVLNQIISGAVESCTTFLKVGSQRVVLVIGPILVDGKPEGAILSCSPLRRPVTGEEERLKEQYLKGFAASQTLEGLEREFPDLGETAALAKIYAQSSSPVLVEGYAGPELDMLCEGIHNYSLRRSGPFIVINLAGMGEDQQMRTLFGERTGQRGREDFGAVGQADKGTLVVQSIDKMTLPVQYHFSKMLRSRKLLRYSVEEVRIVDIRLIACTSKDIDTCRRLNRMRSDLYYSLNALKLRIPVLKDRPQDKERLLDACIRRYLSQYSCYHTLTAGARKALMEYDWPGNTIQLRAFCERMILTVGRRTITEEYVRGLLGQLYQNTMEPDYYTKHGLAPREEKREGDTEAVGLKELTLKALKESGGNRAGAAKRLGISTTTLWRRMKAYGIEF